MGGSIVLDPYAENSANAAYWIHAASQATGIYLSADGGQSYPPPEPDAIWVSSPETEGQLRANTRPNQRTISVQLQVIEPLDATAVNKATNPMAAVGTTGWTNSSLVLMERQTTLPAFLEGFTTAIHATSNADDDSSYLSAAVTNAVAETFSAWVYVVSGTVRLEVWTAVPAQLAVSSNITAGSWQRIVLPYTPNTTATYQFRVSQNGAGTAEWYVTGMQIGPVDPFFSGDTPGCYWTGARHASTSTRRAPGGPRYAGIKDDLENKIADMDRAGGTFRRYLPTGEPITFDVQQARIVSWQEDIIAELRNAIKVDVEFLCQPYGRGLEVTV